MSKQRNDAPKNARPAFDGMIFTAQFFRPQQADDIVSIFVHFSRIPSRKMFLQIIIGGVALRQKSAGGEENDFFGRNFSMSCISLTPSGFGQMLDDVEGDTRVELFWERKYRSSSRTSP
jgi:hypothetical protein